MTSCEHGGPPAYQTIGSGKVTQSKIKCTYDEFVKRTAELSVISFCAVVTIRILGAFCVDCSTNSEG